MYLFTNLVVNSLLNVLIIVSLLKVVLSKKDKAGVIVPSILKEDLKTSEYMDHILFLQQDFLLTLIK